MQTDKPYAYSFDRETFQGAFATREQAADAGLRAAQQQMNNVPSVFVGKRVAIDPQADGHADAIARSMRQRMLASSGDAGYLAAANEHVLADLDAQLAATIVGWLTRHELVPAAKVKSISEYPLPTVHAHGPSRDDEVQLMGGEME